MSAEGRRWLALADFDPDDDMARRCLTVADHVLAVTAKHFPQG
jgi:hypothetical protein